MNSSTVINALYSFFGKKKNILTWSGSLEDLKAFVLTIVDEETAESSTWRSPSGGKWCFDSDQLKVTWYAKSEAIFFEGTKATDLSKRMHGILVESVDPKKVKNSDLNKSLECFMAEESTEVDNISPDETPGPCTSLLQVSNISCCNISNNNHVENVLELGESCNHEAMTGYW
jgi:hypothetical protein